MPDAAPILGVLAALAGVADTVPYVRDMVRGTTRPHRGSWLIWTVLAVVACLAQRADGASWSIVLTATQAVLTGLVFVLALRYGERGLAAADLSLLAVAAMGVAGWLVAREPVVAVTCVIVADASAAAMMTPKAYREPCSETLSTYVLAAIGGVLAAGAVGAADPSLLLYPVYFALVNAAVATLLFVRRARLAAVPREPAFRAAT